MSDYDTRLGGAPAVVFMAKKYYDTLPPAARKILDENSGEAASRMLGKAWGDVAEEARQKTMADSKQKVVEPTAAQTAVCEKVLAPVTANWERETPGGAKVLTTFRKILADVEAGK